MSHHKPSQLPLSTSSKLGLYLFPAGSYGQAMTGIVAKIRAGEDRARLEAILSAVDVDEAELSSVAAVLIDVLEDRHPGLRQAAMDVLSRLATDRGWRASARVVERVIALSRDPSPKVRQEAAASLAILGDGIDAPGRDEAVLALLRDPELEVRREAAAALGDLKAERAREPLASLLEDRDRGLRFEAAFALASLQDARARPILEEALQKSAQRLDACMALRRLASVAALPALEAASNKLMLPWADRLTLLATRYALGDRSVASGIVERTSARSREEQSYAIALLGSHRITEGLSRLIDLAARPGAHRDTAIRALGELGATEARPTLQALLGDSSLSVELQEDARQALLRLG